MKDGDQLLETFEVALKAILSKPDMRIHFDEFYATLLDMKGMKKDLTPEEAITLLAGELIMRPANEAVIDPEFWRRHPVRPAMDKLFAAIAESRILGHGDGD